MTYFIRLKSNNTLKNLIEPYLERPTGSLLKSGIEEKFIDLSYQAGSWEIPRRVVCRIAWHENEGLCRKVFNFHQPLLCFMNFTE